MEDLNEREKGFFRPICNDDEIERIFNVQNAKDYLLKLRAETIVDHMRLFRVYRNKALEKEKTWSLEDSFNNKHYIQFKEALPHDLKKMCEENITFGDIFSNDANGMIFNSDYGIITTISTSLSYFIKFMNLGFFNLNNKVPNHIKANSIRIGLRVMLQSETLDFKMDPRGIIPHKIEKLITNTYAYQLQFLAGHEFSHFILGHLDKNDTSELFFMKKQFNSRENYGLVNVYNTQEKQELDADVNAINLPNYSQIDKKNIFENALLFFAILSIYEAVSECICPSIGPRSHPEAMDRYYNLLEKIDHPRGFNKHRYVSDIPRRVNEYRNVFIIDISENCESYEKYGSAYLSEPNTKWRGRKRIDRVDYY